MSILFSIQDIFQVHRQIMLIANVVSLFMIGFVLIHLNNVVSFTKPIRQIVGMNGVPG